MSSAPLLAPDSVPFLPTMQVLTTGDQDTSPGVASRSYRGDLTQLLVGVRSAIRIEVLKERYADSLHFGFLAHARFDGQLQNPEAFAMVTGILG